MVSLSVCLLYILVMSDWCLVQSASVAHFLEGDWTGIWFNTELIEGIAEVAISASRWLNQEANIKS